MKFRVRIYYRTGVDHGNVRSSFECSTLEQALYIRAFLCSGYHFDSYNPVVQEFIDDEKFRYWKYVCG